MLAARLGSIPTVNLEGRQLGSRFGLSALEGRQLRLAFGLSA